MYPQSETVDIDFVEEKFRENKGKKNPKVSPEIPKTIHPDEGSFSKFNEKETTTRPDDELDPKLVNSTSATTFEHLEIEEIFLDVCRDRAYYSTLAVFVNSAFLLIGLFPPAFLSMGSSLATLWWIRDKYRFSLGDRDDLTDPRREFLSWLSFRRDAVLTTHHWTSVSLFIFVCILGFTQLTHFFSPSPESQLSRSYLLVHLILSTSYGASLGFSAYYTRKLIALISQRDQKLKLGEI